MRIWNGEINTAMLNDLNRNTLGRHLGIEFTEVGDDFIVATMPVTDNTRQPFGLLHGGASVALAETVGSVASWCMVNRDMFMGVGIEINANHVRPVTEGKVTAICKPVKSDGKLHIWDIRLTGDSGQLCCICRFTVMVVPLPKKNA